MILAKGIQKAYETKWSMANTFTIAITIPEAIRNNLSTYGLATDFTDEFSDQLNLHIKSIDTPDFNNEPIEAYINNKWRINNGKETVKQFAITFKDHNQMSLYRKFLHLYDVTKVSYFDDVAMTVTVGKDPDWANESEQPFMEFTGVIVMAVSNLSLSNETESQIAEFTVTFKCTDVSVIMLKNTKA